MPLRIPLLLYLLPLALSATFSNDCKPPTGETGYIRFLREHFDNPKTPGDDYCNIMMHRRCVLNLDHPKISCKETNTFIHAPKTLTQAACLKMGSSYGNNQRISHGRFSVTTCRVKGNATATPCQYSGSIATRKIVISCENKLPLLLQEGVTW